MELIIVRRGDTERFHFLQEIYRSQPSVHVIWDRRVADRRRAASPVGNERRQSDRRAAPPRSWTTMGFIFVEQVAVRPAAKVSRQRQPTLA